MMPLRLLRQTIRLMLVVMLLGALAPTVSRAMAATRGSVVGADICHTPGVRPADPGLPAALAHIALSGQAQPEDGSHSALVLDHCPFCPPVAERLGPPSALPVHFFDAEPGLAPPDVRAPFFALHLILTVWARGPPALA